MQEETVRECSKVERGKAYQGSKRKYRGPEDVASVEERLPSIPQALT